MISEYKSLSAYPLPPRGASPHGRSRKILPGVTDVESASTVVFLPPPKSTREKRLRRLNRSGTDAVTEFTSGESGTSWRRGRSRHLKWTVEDQSIATRSSSVYEKARHGLPEDILRSRREEIEPLNSKSGPSHQACVIGPDPGPSHTNADSAVSADSTGEKSTRFRSLPSVIEGNGQKGAGVRDGAESVPGSSRSGPDFRCQTDSGTDKTSSNSSLELSPAEQAALRLQVNRSSRALPIAQPCPQTTIVAALVEGSNLRLISPGQGRCSNPGAQYSSRLDDGTSWTETLLRSLYQREQDLTREISHSTLPVSPDGYVRRAVVEEDVASIEELQRLRLEEEEREFLSGPFSLGSTSVGLALRCQAGEEPLQHPEEGFPAGSQEGQSVSRALRAESEVRRMEEEALRLKREKEEDDDGLSVWPVGMDRKAKVRFVTAREAMHIQRGSITESTAIERDNKRRRLEEVVGSQESADSQDAEPGSGADGSQTQEEEEIPLTPSKKRRRRLPKVTANENAVLASTSSRSIGDSTCCCQRSRTSRGAKTDCVVADQSNAGTSRSLITSPFKTVEPDPRPISSTPVLTVITRAATSPRNSLRMRELQPIPSYSTGSSEPALLPAQGANRSVCRFDFSWRSRSVNDGSSSSIRASRRRISDTSKASDGVTCHITRTTIPDGASSTNHRSTFGSSMTRGKESDAFIQSPEEEEEEASDSHPSRIVRRSSDRDQATSSKMNTSISKCVTSAEARALPAPPMKASTPKVCEGGEESKGPSTSRTSATEAESRGTTLDLATDRSVPKRPPPVPILPLRSSSASARSHRPSKLAQSLTAESLDRSLNASAFEGRDAGDGSSSAGTTTGAPGHTTTITGLDSIPPPPALHFDPRNMASLLSILRNPTPFLSAKHGGPMEHCNSPRLNLLLLIREVGPVEEIATKVFRGGKVVEGAREMMARCEMIVMDGEGGMGRVVLWGDCATDWICGDIEDEDGGDVGGPDETESSIATHAGMTTTLDGGRGDDTTTYGGVLLKNLRRGEQGVSLGQQTTSTKTQKAKAKTGWRGCLRPGDVICLSSVIVSPLQAYPHQAARQPCGRQAIQIVASPRTSSRVEVCWRWDLPSSRSNRLRHERERRKFRFDEALVDFDRRCRDVWKCAVRWEGVGRE